MPKAFIINGHYPFPSSPGNLNAELVRRIDANLRNKGFETKHTMARENYDVEEEIEKHLWMDVLIIQCPVNSMGLPWPLKKYMDEVYTAGMQGQLCVGDGRRRDAPKKNYGGGGKLEGKKFMYSLTFNAPEEAFNDPSEYLFQGKSVDDLFFPNYMNLRFFALEGLPTFSCFDVKKNAEIESDFDRLDAHLDLHLPIGFAA